MQSENYLLNRLINDVHIRIMTSRVYPEVTVDHGVIVTVVPFDFYGVKFLRYLREKTSAKNLDDLRQDLVLFEKKVDDIKQNGIPFGVDMFANAFPANQQVEPSPVLCNMTGRWPQYNVIQSLDKITIQTEVPFVYNGIKFSRLFIEGISKTHDTESEKGDKYLGEKVKQLLTMRIKRAQEQKAIPCYKDFFTGIDESFKTIENGNAFIAKSLAECNVKIQDMIDQNNLFYR